MIKTLVKKQLMEIFRSYYYDTKKNKARTKAVTLLYMALFVFLMVGVVGGLMAFLSVGICAPLSAAGMDWIFFALMGLIAILLGAFGSVFNTYTGLYMAKDNDFLLSMPIPVSSVIVSRLLGVYLMGLMYSGIVAVPAAVVYWIVISAAPSVILGSLLFVLLISVFVLVLSCLLGWVVAKVSIHLKNKSFTTVLISLVLLGGYYFVYFKAQVWIRDLVEHAAEYGAKVKESAYPIVVIGSVAAGDWKAMGIVTLAVAIAACLTWLLLSRSFLGLATATGKTVRTRYRLDGVKMRDIPRALLSRELNRFTGSAGYMLNCGLGTLLLPALGVLLLIKGDSMVETLSLVFGTMPGSTVMLLISVICLVGTMNDMAAPSVALEGKSLWLAQSLPVTSWQVLRAKLWIQILLTNLPMIFASLCGILLVKPGFAEALGILLIPQLFSVCMACLDLVMGLQKPNLNWTSEIVPIKQSMSVLVALLGGFALEAVLGGGFFLGGWHLGIGLYLLLEAVLLAGITVFLFSWLKKRGTALFEAL